MAKRKRKPIEEWANLIRWKNTGVALACVAAALTLGETRLPCIIKLLIYSAVGLIFAGGNVINDYVDYESDAVGHPNRPIPSGTIERKIALIMGIVFFIGGVLFAALGAINYGPIPALIAIGAALLLLFYDFIGGKIPFVGNFAVAILGGLVFIYPGSVQGLTKKHIFAAGFAVLIHLGREIVKDIADRAADESVGIRTLPSIIGDTKAARLASACLFLIVPLTILPYFIGVFSVWYLGTAILFVDLPIILLAWLFPVGVTARKASKFASDLKWIMIGGLVALLLGGLTS